MKPLIPLCLIAFFISGCASTQIQSSAPLIKTAGAVATEEALARVPYAKQKTAANYVYSIAVGLRTLSGTTPTIESLSTVLESFGQPDDPEIERLVSSLSQLYGNYLTQFAGNNDKLKSAAIVLEALAEGAEQGADLYRTSK